MRNWLDARTGFRAGLKHLLDEPLPKGIAGRVRLIILLGEDEPSESEWLKAVAQGGAFDFLSAPEEDIYSLSDGKPFNDAR